MLTYTQIPYFDLDCDLVCNTTMVNVCVSLDFARFIACGNLVIAIIVHARVIYQSGHL